MIRVLRDDIFIRHTLLVSQVQVNIKLLGYLLKQKKTGHPKWMNALLKLMLEQQKGNKILHGYDDQICTAITTSFNERCKLQYDYRDLQDRYTYFMKQFNEVKYLINQNGFSWDDTCQMVISNDDAWEIVSKEHPYATSYIGTILRHHKYLSTFVLGCGSEILIVKSETPVDMETDAIG